MINLRNNQPIYKQIVDYLCYQIVNNKYLENERIPSARDLAVQLEINPNTIVRSFEILQNHGIIQMKRGLGYFVSKDGKDKAIHFLKNMFIEDFLPDFFKNMQALDISMDEIEDLFKDYKTNKEKDLINQ